MQLDLSFQICHFDIVTPKMDIAKMRRRTESALLGVTLTPMQVGLETTKASTFSTAKPEKRPFILWFNSINLCPDD